MKTMPKMKEIRKKEWTSIGSSFTANKMTLNEIVWNQIDVE